MTTDTHTNTHTHTAPPISPATELPSSALRFITCGSVDDGKSTLIGRLLVDSQAVLQDHLAGVQRRGQTDLALLTDGLSAEREQGITIDVAYRYFRSERRKFIIGDAPGHEQYTRNMVTAASSADAAVVLVDATKLDWRQPEPSLLVQTRRHSLLLKRLRVPSVLFAVNKLDAVEQPELAYAHIAHALRRFADQAGLAVQAVVPVSALHGQNVVHPEPGWCGYHGPSLLQALETLPSIAPESELALHFAVQWVEVQPFNAVLPPGHSRRVFWGRLGGGALRLGQTVRTFPSGQTAQVVQLLSATRQPLTQSQSQSAGVVLDRELDVSRGDWLVDASTDAATTAGKTELSAVLTWLDEVPLQAGRVYWALHGHRWIKARVSAIEHRIDINTLAEAPAEELPVNAMGRVRLSLQAPLLCLPYAESRLLGALVLVDPANHKTVAAVWI